MLGGSFDAAPAAMLPVNPLPETATAEAQAVP
jgi:hypothetical protein